MMKIVEVKYSKAFDKSFIKLPPKKQQKVRKTIITFVKDPRTRSLRFHELEGSLAGIWSISAGGDLRLHFRYEGDAVVFFLAVGTHSQLY